MEKVHKRIALYIRVSMKDQNPKNQLYALRRFCKEMKWRAVTEFVDHGAKGWSKSRPELNRMLKELEEGKFDMVLVWSFDRASRDCGFSIQLLDKLHSLGVAFYSYTQRIDTLNPYGRHQYISIANDAELETAKISIRTKAGMELARARGKRFGRKPWISKPDVIELKNKGLTNNEISTQLKISTRYVRRIIYDLQGPCFRHRRSSIPLLMR